MSMIARLPPKALAMPAGFMMPRTVNCLAPSMVPSAILLPMREVVACRRTRS